jgi:hypothetical protein
MREHLPVFAVAEPNHQATFVAGWYAALNSPTYRVGERPAVQSVTITRIDDTSE